MYCTLHSVYSTRDGAVFFFVYFLLSCSIFYFYDLVLKSCSIILFYYYIFQFYYIVFLLCFLLSCSLSLKSGPFVSIQYSIFCLIVLLQYLGLVFFVLQYSLYFLVRISCIRYSNMIFSWSLCLLQFSCYFIVFYYYLVMFSIFLTFSVSFIQVFFFIFSSSRIVRRIMFEHVRQQCCSQDYV